MEKLNYNDYSLNAYKILKKEGIDYESEVQPQRVRELLGFQPDVELLERDFRTLQGRIAALRKILLQQRKMDLVFDTKKKVYYIAHPRDQAVRAVQDCGKEIKRALNKAVTRVENTNMDMLTATEQRVTRDAISKLAGARTNLLIA